MVNALAAIIIGTAAYLTIYFFPRETYQQTPKPAHISIDGEINRQVEINGCVYVQGPTFIVHDNENCERCKNRREQELQQLADMIVSALKSN